MTPLPLLLTAPLLLAVVSVRAQQERVTEERVREVVTWLASDERNGRDTGSRELEAASQWKELDALLDRWSTRPTCPPALLEMLGFRYEAAPGGREDAWRTYLRASRRASVADAPLERMADFVWEDPETRDLTVGLARIFACTKIFDEGAASRYANFCIDHGEREEALRFLQERAERFANSSNYPVTTYARWLAKEGQRAQAIELLQNAPEADPRSRAWLIEELFDQLMDAGRYDESEQLIDREASRLRPHLVARLRCRLARQRGDRATALAMLEESLARNPTSSQEWEELFDLQFGLHGRAGFIERVRQLLGDEEPTSEALQQAWHACLAKSEYELAHEVVDRFVEVIGDSNWARGSRSRTLTEQGRTEEALTIAQQVVEADPFSLIGWVDLAACQAALGQLEDARSSLRRRLELGRAYPTLYQRLFSTAASEAELRELIEEVQQKMLEMEPPVGCVHQVAGTALHHFPLEEVDGWLARLCERYPFRGAFARVRVDTLSDAGRHKEAEAVARTAWEADPEDSRVGIQLARELESLGRKDEHLEHLRSLHEACPHVVAVANELAMAYDDRREFAAAEKVYRASLERFPEAPTVHGCYADSLWKSSRKEEALEQVALACEISSTYLWAWRAQVYWLASLDREEEALEVARRLVQLQPTEPGSYDLLASACRSNYLDAEGQQALERAVALAPNSLEYVSTLADWHRRHGRNEEAKVVLQEGRGRMGNHPTLAVAEAEILRGEGQFKDARELLREALEAFPDHVHSWETYANWLLNDRRADELVELAKDPPPAVRYEAWIPLQAGRALNAADRDVEAVRYFERAYALAPGDEYYWAQLLGARRDAEDKEGVRRLLERQVDLQTATEDTLEEMTRAAVMTEHSVLTETVAALLRLPQNHPALWYRISQQMEQRAMRDQVRGLARDLAEASDEISTWTNAAMLHLEFPYEDKSKRRGFRQQRALLDEFGHRFATHPEFASKLAEFAGLPRATTNRGLHSWIKQVVTLPVEDAELWGSLGYMLAPYSPKWVLEALVPNIDREDARPWMLSHLIDALIGLGRLDEAEAQLQRAFQMQADRSYAHLRCLMAEVALHRGDDDWILAHPRERRQLNYRDRIRDFTIHEIARARTQTTGRQRRSVYRSWLKRVAPRSFERVPGVPLLVGRDLLPGFWSRVLRSPRPQLLRLGRLHLAFHLDD